MSARRRKVASRKPQRLRIQSTHEADSQLAIQLDELERRACPVAGLLGEVVELVTAPLPLHPLLTHGDGCRGPDNESAARAADTAGATVRLLR